MGCPKCRRRIRNRYGERVRYCKCGHCNHCHPGGVTTYHGSVGYSHWYKDARAKGSAKRWSGCQSNGGDYIPYS